MKSDISQAKVDLNFKKNQIIARKKIKVPGRTAK